MVRVLQIFSHFEQGGIENFIMNVYRNMDRTQVQFDFALTENSRGLFEDEIEALGGRCFYFTSNKKGLWNIYCNLQRIIRENGPYAAVHSHLYYASGFFLFVAKLCGVKIRIAHSHDTLKGRKRTFFRTCYERCMRWMIKKNATHRLACSNMAGECVFGKDAFYTVLYNGIDLTRFRYDENNRIFIRKELGYENTFVVMNVGRFAPQKNHCFIVAVFYELLKTLKNAQLLLIGSGAMRKEIEEKCNDLGIMDKVTILSDIHNTEAYYAAADAFILPSLYEGMGIVNVESQACGLNTLISDKVTTEVAVTELVQYLPIDKETSVTLWAEELSAISKRKVDRSEYWARFISSPFNIDVTVKNLMSIYTSNN